MSVNGKGICFSNESATPSTPLTALPSHLKERWSGAPTGLSATLPPRVVVLDAGHLLDGGLDWGDVARLGRLEVHYSTAPAEVTAHAAGVGDGPGHRRVVAHREGAGTGVGRDKRVLLLMVSPPVPRTLSLPTL